MNSAEFFNISGIQSSIEKSVDSQNLKNINNPNLENIISKKLRINSHPLVIQTGTRIESTESEKNGSSLVSLRRPKNFDPSFHRGLKEAFPDWDERMDYQKKQEKFYKSALRLKEEITSVRQLDKTIYYSKEQLDAINYFHGIGIYEKYQDLTVKPNIFDTRKSFLLKMHDRKLRNEFLNSFNRRNN